MEWLKRSLTSDAVRTLAKRYEIDLLTASVLLRRGIETPEKIFFYLRNNLSSVHNPFLFREMEDVIDRILGAKQESEKVLVFGDRDADGIMSTVLMVEALQELGIETYWKVPEGDAPYGLSPQAVEWFSSLGGTLIVTVDCGISNMNEVAQANLLGIDVLIIDHHKPGATLPQAMAIINPCSEGERYPFPFLAACGVVSKVIWALRFAQIPLYHRQFCLMRCYQTSTELVIEAVRLMNLVEQKRCYFTFKNSLSPNDRDNLVQFFADHEILVFDEKEQLLLLRHLFGTRIQISLNDIAPMISQAFPEFTGLTFTQIKAKSKFEHHQGLTHELDVLYNLFVHSIYHCWPQLGIEYSKILDLTCLGTLADLMPMENENRILVRRGMEVFNQTSRQGLRDLLLQLKLLGQPLSTIEVSWSVIPLINAAGRMGVPQKAVELLLTSDPLHSQALAQELKQLNTERRQLCERVWEQILPKARDSLKSLQQRMILVHHSSILRGITGILASRLMNVFKVPAIVVANQETGVVGSLRTSENFEAKLFLDQFQDLFSDYGGHDRAGGFQLPSDKTHEFYSRIADVLANFPLAQSSKNCLELDADLPQDHLTPQLWQLIEALEPYGENNPPLIFACRGLKILSLFLVGKTESKHVRMTLESTLHKWPAIYWNALDRFENREFGVGDKVNVVFHLTRNHYQHQKRLQLTILDLVRC